MKKWMCLLCAAAASVAAFGSECLKNGKFDMEPAAAKEEMPENCTGLAQHWFTYNAKDSKGKIWQIKKAGAGFDDDFALLARGFKDGCIMQKIAVFDGEKYTVSALIRYKGICRFSVAWQDTKGAWCCHKENKYKNFDVNMGKGWRKAEIPLTVPEGANFLVVKIILTNQGEDQDCLIDNASVVQTE